MRSKKTEAIVIRKRNFSEKDRILTLFSREYGKIDAIAKGSRRPGSRFSYFSDIGSIGVFYLYESKSIPIVTDYKSIFLPEGAIENFKRTERLSFAFKLVDKLFESGQEHPQTYLILRQATQNLSNADSQMFFLAFLHNLICDLGIKPELYKCMGCGKKILETDKLVFDFSGGVCHDMCAKSQGEKINQGEIKLLRLYDAVPYNKISTARVDQKIFKKVYKIVSKYINWNFGEILPNKIL